MSIRFLKIFLWALNWTYYIFYCIVKGVYEGNSLETKFPDIVKGVYEGNSLETEFPDIVKGVYEGNSLETKFPDIVKEVYEIYMGRE